MVVEEKEATRIERDSMGTMAVPAKRLLWRQYTACRAQFSN